ncbi:MAG: LLM class flavin-dependent oxidoreductase [Candidatus Nanopelagicales bacterium]
MTIRLGYGLITCQSHPDDPRDWQELVDEALGLTVRAEEIGLDSAWVSEHHHVDDGHLGALLVMLSAMAASTQSITLGTAVLLAPLHDPVRVAEEAQLVDLVSHGRLVLGLGIGWREEEFAVAGVAQKDRVPRLLDTIEVLRRGSAGLPTRLSRDGSPLGRITPRSASTDSPPIWIGALAEPAIARAGRTADGFMATEVTPPELASQVDIARRSASEAGRDPRALSIAVHLPTLVTDEPWESIRDLLRYPGWKYGDMDGQMGSHGPLGRPGPWEDGEEARLQATSLVGTPDVVAARIREYAGAVGGDLTFIARSYLPGAGEAAQRQALERLGEVLPLL